LDLRKRFCGTVVDVDSTGRPVDHVKPFLVNLLLFETCIIDSFRLEEWGRLLALFGYDAVVTLLRDPSIELNCDAVFVGCSRTDAQVQRMPSGLLRVGPLALLHGGIVREYSIPKYLERLRTTLPLSAPQIDDLSQVISNKILPRPVNAGSAAFEHFVSDLGRNVPSVREAMSRSVRWRMSDNFDTTPLSIEFHALDHCAVDVVTNLHNVPGVGEDGVTDIAVSVAVAVGGISERLEKMRNLTCILGTVEDELPIFSSELAFIASSVAADAQVGRFERVLQVAGLPDLDPKTIDLPRLLEVRRSRECAEFRDWLWTIDSLSESELSSRLTSLTGRLATWTHGRTGKAARWLVSTGLGLIPGGGLVLGPGADLLDTFVVERLLPQRGLLTFLGHQYPSLFARHS
jgi:hypothetical protein